MKDLKSVLVADSFEKVKISIIGLELVISTQDI